MPQLEHTPGAFISLDSRSVETAFFRVDYPDGWRVVKVSVASAPLQLVFASPDDSMTIIFSESPFPEVVPSATVIHYEETIFLSDDEAIFVRGEAPVQAQAQFERIVAAMRYSITIP